MIEYAFISILSQESLTTLVGFVCHCGGVLSKVFDCENGKTCDNVGLNLGVDTLRFVLVK